MTSNKIKTIYHAARNKSTENLKNKTPTTFELTSAEKQEIKQFVNKPKVSSAEINRKMYDKDSMNNSFTQKETASQRPTLKDEVTTIHKDSVKVDDESLK